MQHPCQNIYSLWDKFSINSSGISLYGMHAQLMAVVVWSLSMMLHSKPAFKKYCVPLLVHPFLLRIRGVVGDGWIDHSENLQWCDNCYGKYIYVSNVYYVHFYCSSLHW